jgi:hypothetical protein
VSTLLDGVRIRVPRLSCALLVIGPVLDPRFVICGCLRPGEMLEYLPLRIDVPLRGPLGPPSYNPSQATHFI